MKRFFIGALCLICLSNVVIAAKAKVKSKNTPKLKISVDSVYSSVDDLLQAMSLDEKIAQLIIIRSFAENDDAYYEEIAARVKMYQYGGVCFFKGNTSSYQRAYNLYQKVATIPLLSTIDGEWGAAMRFTDLHAFPRQQTLGAIQNDSLIFQMGQMVGWQCQQLGIHFNYIPSVDINSNAKNPVINTRSFGEDKDNVARKGAAYFQGMSQYGILGSAKHFPGHGDTEVDSHDDMPKIFHSRQMVDTLDLYPFKKMIASGVDAIMVAHLNIPSLDSSSLPASLSSYIIDTVLRRDLGFQGLVITDGLEMQGVVKKFKNGEAEVMALIGGNDLLLLPMNPEVSVAAIRKAVASGRISEARIDRSCRRVLEYKEKLGLLNHLLRPNASDTVKKTWFLEEKDYANLLNNEEFNSLSTTLFENAITLVENKKQLLPLHPEDEESICVLHIGDSVGGPLQEGLDRFVKLTHVYLHRDFNPNLSDSILANLSKYKTIVVSLTNTNHLVQRNYGITNQSIQLVDRLKTDSTSVVLVVFASPYSLALFKNIENLDAVLVGFQEQPTAQEVLSRILFGSCSPKGKLPVRVGDLWQMGRGLTFTPSDLAYANPIDHGFSPNCLMQIDSLASLGILAKAYPGCQILIAKDGKIVFSEAFGRHTYDSASPKVELTDLYDIASLTKIYSTTLAMMKLYDQGAYQLDEPMSLYMKSLKKTNKKKMTFRQVLSHQAGLPPILNFYPDSLYKGEAILSKVPTEHHTVQISDSLYRLKKYEKKIREIANDSELKPNPTYLYSDIGFYYLKEFIEKKTKMSLDEYMSSTFFDSLNLSHITYKPRAIKTLEQIVPTEYDKNFRKQLIHGYVHDPSVALMGGVGGAAGLFSNVHDLAVLSLMLLNDGEYGGKRYIDSTTVALFTSSSFSEPENRRGGGFDKPALSSEQASPCAAFASPDSYGHSGFTGTYVWVDPQQDLVYIFLSNRVYPEANENKLAKMNLRTQIQEVIYRCLNKGDF